MLLMIDASMHIDRPPYEPDFSYKVKTRAYFALKSGFKRACPRFSGLCAPPAPHSALKRDIEPACATCGSVCREEAEKYAFTPPVKKQTQKKVTEIWPGSEGWLLRSSTDGSSRDMVPGSLFKVETLVGGIPPGTFSFQDPHKVIIEDAGMDFLNHPRSGARKMSKAALSTYQNVLSRRYIPLLAGH